MVTREQAFAAALVELEGALDWELLGDLYCHEGGESFFPPEQREAIREAGLHFAADLAGELEADRETGRSLYVGAALAELAPILCETLVLGREVVALNPDTAEAAELNRGLASVGASLDLALPRVEPLPLAQLDAEERGFDHGWLVSVLSDPDAFPALHLRVYDRGEPEAGALARDLDAARALAADLVARLAPGALLTTTDEELPIVLEVCTAAGRSLDVPDRARLSAVVGDPVRICRLDG